MFIVQSIIDLWISLFQLISTVLCVNIDIHLVTKTKKNMQPLPQHTLKITHRNVTRKRVQTQTWPAKHRPNGEGGPEEEDIERSTTSHHEPYTYTHIYSIHCNIATLLTLYTRHDITPHHYVSNSNGTNVKQNQVKSSQRLYRSMTPYIYNVDTYRRFQPTLITLN